VHSDPAPYSLVASASDLNDSENWHGGFYELAIELGRLDDARLERSLEVLWASAGMQGSFAPTNGDGHVPVALGRLSLEQHGHLRGVVEPPGFGPLVAGVIATRFDSDEIDWLELYIPLGALGRTDPRIGSFPFGPDGTKVSLAWRRGLDAWLADIGRSVFRAVPFRRALIGYEVDDDEWVRPPRKRMNAFLIVEGPDLIYLEANASPSASFSLSRMARVQWAMRSAIRSLANRLRRPREAPD
jgi:hypothetical protein